MSDRIVLMIGPMICRLSDTRDALASNIDLSWESQNCIIGPQTPEPGLG